MRLREFASAEDQLALLKLIMDHTWAALATQAAAQAQERARTKAAGLNSMPPYFPMEASTFLKRK